MKLVPDEILKKYCKLFSVKDDNVKKHRLLLQDVIATWTNEIGILNLWSVLHTSKTVVCVSFKARSFYTSNTNSNMIKIIIPLDILNFFAKKILRIFLSFFITTTNNNNLSSEKKKF